MVSKSEYISKNKGFIAYLVKVIKGKEKIRHSYLDGALKFETLEDACEKYLFPMKSTESRSLKDHKKFENKKRKGGLNANEKKLSEVRKKLISSKKSGDQDKFYDAVCLALYWGATGEIVLKRGTKRKGTYYANKKWIDQEIRNNDIDIIKHYEDACSLVSGADPDIAKFGKDGTYRMNAGFTKVYSLLIKNFIIYDGRVGAALGYLVTKYCSEDPKLFNDCLKFSWGSPESGGTKGRAPYRNPSIKEKGLVFVKLDNSKGEDWARCNIYANWLLEAAMKGVGWEFNGVKGQAALRRVEAALFMIGYDFPGREKEEVPSVNTRSTTDDELRRVVKECQKLASKRPNITKKELAIFALEQLQGCGRQQIMSVFMEGCGLTTCGASTYYYNLKPR